MKIFILSTTKESTGGVERFSAYLKDGVISLGHTADIISFEDLSVGQKRIVKWSRFAGLYQPTLGFFLGKIASKKDFDVCVTNGMLGWNMVNKNTVNIQHGTFARSADRIDRGRNFFKFFIKKYIWGHFEELAGKRANVCVAVSKEVKESVEKYYHIENCIVVQNATDTSFFKPDDKNESRKKMGLPLDIPICIFVGRFEIAKGKHILEKIQSHMKSIGGQLIVAERYSQEELSMLYTASDVFALPSLHEGCSYALLDAMSCGLPFVASPVGLVKEFVESSIFPECTVLDYHAESYCMAIDSMLAMEIPAKNNLSNRIRNYIITTHAIGSFNNAYEKIFKQLP